MNIYLVGGAVRDQLLGLAVKAQIETPRMTHVFNVCLNLTGHSFVNERHHGTKRTTMNIYLVGGRGEINGSA